MSKNHNYYFKVYLKDKDTPLKYFHIIRSIDILKNMSMIRDNLYEDDIKDILIRVFHESLYIMSKQLEEYNIKMNENIGVQMITEYEYRQNNSKFDNEMKFVEYLISEQAQHDKHTNISEDILRSANFERVDEEWERSIMTDEYYIKDYSSWKICTISVDNYENSLNINLSKGNTNNGALWHVHIDNNACMTIGCADISTVWQFNTFMEILGSKFRL